MNISKNYTILRYKAKTIVAIWAIEVLTALPWNKRISLWVDRLVYWREGVC